jgi:hypothetical protein
MERPEVIAPNRWKQSVLTSKKRRSSVADPGAVVTDCNIKDGMRRLIKLMLAPQHKIDVEDEFAITSGCEIRFFKALQLQVCGGIHHP